MKTTDKELDELKHQIHELESKLEKNKRLVKEIEKEEKSPLYDIYTWKAPDRIFVEHSKNWYSLVSIAAVVSILFSLLTGNYMLIVAIVAVIILIYAMNTVPPRTIEYSLTNRGFRVEDDLYLWNDIDYFWITERNNELVISIELKELKGRLIALVGNGDINKILSELAKHEDYREPKGIASIIGRLTEGRYKKFTDFSGD